MSKRTIARSTCIVALLLFILSTLPLSSLQVANDGDLRSVITHIQQIQQVEHPVDFKIVFANTITSLQAAAGFHTLFTEKNNSSDTQKSQITISVRLPYLIPTNIELEIGDISTKLSPIEYSTMYRSFITTPELPPPIYSPV